MDRRHFLKQIFFWSAGLTLTVPRFTISAELLAAEKPSSLLSVGVDTDYVALVNRVIDALGGMKQFVKSGDKVVVKPNIGWDRSPEQAANTHPLVVKAVVELALAAGAAKVMVFDRTCNEERRCYTNSGIKDTLESIKDPRLKFYHPDSRKYVPVDIAKGKAVNRLEIYKDALEADSYINVPVAKHHGLSKLTMGLKNSMGLLGGERGQMHHNLGQKLADLATIIRPSLTVIDATRVLLANGPQGGDIKDVKVLNTIIASTDPVAADAYTTTLFDLQPDAIESTVAAYRMGLGEMQLDKLTIKKI